MSTDALPGSADAAMPHDPSAIASLQSFGGASLALEMAGLYLEQAPQWLALALGAAAAGDAQTLRRATHSMKSSSLHLGAMRVGAMAREIEHIASTGDVARASAMLPEFERVVDAACGWLRQQVEELEKV